MLLKAIVTIIKEIFRAAVLGLSIAAAPAMAHELPSYQNDTETPRGLFVIIDAYNDLKAVAREPNFWNVMVQISQAGVNLEDPILRLRYALDVISSTKYDRNPTAQRKLAICATRDIATIAQITNLGLRDLKLLAKNAKHHLYHLENSTGDFNTRYSYQQVYQGYAPRRN